MKKRRNCQNTAKKSKAYVKQTDLRPKCIGKPHLVNKNEVGKAENSLRRLKVKLSDVTSREH